MRNCFALDLCLVATTLVSAAELKEVASFPDQQVTGVGVSTNSGRVFVNFPFWLDDHSTSVAEIVNGQPKPFPNEDWNRPGPCRFAFHLRNNGKSTRTEPYKLWKIAGVNRR